jgi:hypothetical protein
MPPLSSVTDVCVRVGVRPGIVDGMRNLTLELGLPAGNPERPETHLNIYRRATSLLGRADSYQRRPRSASFHATKVWRHQIR